MSHTIEMQALFKRKHVHFYISQPFYLIVCCLWAFPGGSVISSITWWGRSPGEGNGNPLQYSCLGNHMDREEPGGPQFMGSQSIRHGFQLTTTAYCLCECEYASLFVYVYVQLYVS